jgi:hypothetical protein
MIELVCLEGNGVMKSYIAVLAATATALSPIAATTSIAQTTVVPKETTAESQCARDVADLAGGTLHDGTPVYSAFVDFGSYSDGAWQETANTRVETADTRQGNGTFSYSDFSIAQGTIAADKPYRVGGSVNMFGDRVATKKNWSNSTYDFTADYTATRTWNYTCQISKATETHTPAKTHTGPVQGYYTNSSDDTDYEDNATDSSETQNHASCMKQPGDDEETPDKWGEDIGHWTSKKIPHTDPVQYYPPEFHGCKFNYTGPGHEVIEVEESWTTDAGLTRMQDLDKSYTVDETIYDTHGGTELQGGPWSETAKGTDRWMSAQVVICISPSTSTKKTVAGWAWQNGYGGVNCTTAWFKIAPYGGGSQTSNGTYISVPGY